MIPRPKVDVGVEVAKLLEQARGGAKSLGHAVVIVRRGRVFFIADSWKDVEGKVVATVSTSGVVVRA